MDEFLVEHYANFGTEEPWVARLMLGLQDLVYAVPAFGATRDAFMNELGEVFESLGMAFEELRSLRKQAAGEGAVPVPSRPSRLDTVARVFTKGHRRPASRREAHSRLSLVSTRERGPCFVTACCREARWLTAVRLRSRAREGDAMQGAAAK
jgi:hypothetical protein